MPKFSESSKREIETLHPDLRLVLNVAIKIVDFKVIEGARSEERQKKLLMEGKTKTMNSKHLTKDKWGKPLSEAVDLAPYPVDWGEAARFYFLAGVIIAVGNLFGIHIRYGGDWDGDHMFDEEKFKDLGHFELVT